MLASGVFAVSDSYPAPRAFYSKSFSRRSPFCSSGGFVDENESLETAALRELEEETGVTSSKMVQTGAYGKFTEIKLFDGCNVRFMEKDRLLRKSVDSGSTESTRTEVGCAEISLAAFSIVRSIFLLFYINQSG